MQVQAAPAEESGAGGDGKKSKRAAGQDGIRESSAPSHS